MNKVRQWLYLAAKTLQPRTPITTKLHQWNLPVPTISEARRRLRRPSKGTLAVANMRPIVAGWTA